MRNTRKYRKVIIILAISFLLIVLRCYFHQTRYNRIIKKETKIDLDVSTFRVEKEVDTHGWDPGGEYLVIFDCKNDADALLKQVRGWHDFPLDAGIESLIFEQAAYSDLYYEIASELSAIADGKWYFYDRSLREAPYSNPNEIRYALKGRDFSLLVYDSDNCRLLFVESDM